MKKNNIGVLITIIVLLCIFLPGAIYGTYKHFQIGALGGNPNKDFYHEGKLYFYNGNTLIGTYTCTAKDCGYAKNSINSEYEFESFNQTANEIEMINNKYAFIQDGEKIKLIDVKTGKAIVDYQEVKNYTSGINDNYYLVKSSGGLWGMIEIKDKAQMIIPFQYQYLGLTNNGGLDASKIIALDKDGWKIINQHNSIIVSVNAEVKNISNNFVLTVNNEVFDYSNNQVLNSYTLTEINLFDDLLIALTNTNTYVIYSANTKTIIGTLLKEENNNYEFNIENNSLVIRANNTVVKTIALN